MALTKYGKKLLFFDKKGLKMQKTNKGKKYRPYKRMIQEEIELIFKLYEEKMELRKIAKI